MTILSTAINRELTRFQGNAQITALLSVPCPQRLLVVTDGSLHFGPEFFGLSEFLAIVRAAGHEVATAHRSGTGGGGATVAGAFQFATAARPVTVANYDQIWLFGYSTAALSPAEQTVIATFMAAGGGVFATGDHETLGAGMGAQLPRVRSMRNWSSVPMSDPRRLDTVLDAGGDGVKQFNDQANAVPQRTFPVWFQTGSDPTRADSWTVHPVLRHPSGAVDCMPDHAHESECLAPVPTAGAFAGIEEWPAPLAGGARIAAQVVSVSMSAGRFISSGAPTLSGTKPPVLPRSFGGISVYDGDAARVGRIVCDATWHHFVNINLNGAGAGSDSTGTPFRGLYVDGAPTPEYLKIQTYYLNTVRWLAPRSRRRCWPVLRGVVPRFEPELRELALPLPHPCPWDPLQPLGLAVEQALSRQWGPGAAAEIVDGVLAAADAPAAFASLLSSGSPPAGTLMPVATLRRALLGQLVNLAAHKLPDEPEALAALMRQGHETLTADLAREAVQATLAVAGPWLQQALKATTVQIKALV